MLQSSFFACFLVSERVTGVIGIFWPGHKFGNKTWDDDSIKWRKEGYCYSFLKRIKICVTDFISQFICRQLCHLLIDSFLQSPQPADWISLHQSEWMGEQRWLSKGSWICLQIEGRQWLFRTWCGCGNVIQQQPNQKWRPEAVYPTGGGATLQEISECKDVNFSGNINNNQSLRIKLWSTIN